MSAAFALALALAPSAPAPKPKADFLDLQLSAPTPELRAEYARAVARLFQEPAVPTYAFIYAREALPSLRGEREPWRAIVGALKVRADERAGAVRVDLRGFPAAERAALRAALCRGWDDHLHGLRWHVSPERVR